MNRTVSAVVAEIALTDTAVIHLPSNDLSFLMILVGRKAKSGLEDCVQVHQPKLEAQPDRADKAIMEQWREVGLLARQVRR